MKVWTTYSITLADNERFAWPMSIGADGKIRELQVQVQTVYLVFDSAHKLDHGWLIGPKVLLRGGLSVDHDSGTTRLDTWEQVPPQFAKMWTEYRETEAR